MKKKLTSLKKVRSEIDKLDDKILPLMIKRSQLVENALELKKLKSQIRDPKRIKIILDKIEKNSEKYDVNKKLLRQIWKSMIECYIDYENKNLKKDNYLL
jgi:chorismate mutase